MPKDAREAWLQLDLVGNPGRVAEVAVSATGKAPTVTTRVEPRERCRIAVRLDSASVSDRLASISIDASGSCALGETTGGLDQRVVSIGVHGFSLAPGGGIAAAAAATGHHATIPV